MEQLFVMDLKDYDDSYTRFVRPSVRGVIIADGKIAMVYSKKHDYYKFPGGGIEKNEDKISALKRELLEETGLTLIENSIEELGSVLRIQKSRFAENEIFEQENFYYMCKVNDRVTDQLLDIYESDEGFTLEYVSPQHALTVNRFHFHGDYDEMLIEREAKVLDYLCEKGFI